MEKQWLQLYRELTSATIKVPCYHLDECTNASFFRGAHAQKVERYSFALPRFVDFRFVSSVESVESLLALCPDRFLINFRSGHRCKSY